MDFLKGFVSNLLFLFFNLGIFYAIYWAYKKDAQIEKEKNDKQKINNNL